MTRENSTRAFKKCLDYIESHGSPCPPYEVEWDVNSNLAELNIKCKSTVKLSYDAIKSFEMFFLLFVPLFVRDSGLIYTRKINFRSHSIRVHHFNWDSQASFWGDLVPGQVFCFPPSSSEAAENILIKRPGWNWDRYFLSYRSRGWYPRDHGGVEWRGLIRAEAESHAAAESDLTGGLSFPAHRADLRNNPFFDFLNVIKCLTLFIKLMRIADCGCLISICI